jgi:hypothetical protein
MADKGKGSKPQAPKGPAPATGKKK